MTAALWKRGRRCSPQRVVLVAMLLEAHGQQDQDALISGIVEGIDSEDVLNDLERCVRKRRCQLPYT